MCIERSLVEFNVDFVFLIYFNKKRIKVIEMDRTSE